MDITVSFQSGTGVGIDCDGQPSHTFQIADLQLPQSPGAWLDFLDDPTVCGQRLYQALFPADQLAQQALVTELRRAAPRLVLIITDAGLQSIPWEYAHDGMEYLVQQLPMLRGLLPDQRRETPAITQPLHIVAVPSDPLGDEIAPLNIDGEWLRLTDVIREIDGAVILERTRPPTLARLADHVAGRSNYVIHFMGHGTRHENAAALLFETENAAPKAELANAIVRRVKRSALLVTLNACVTATPGPTEFGNLAALLVEQGVPYAIGMQFVIADQDALTLSWRFYSMLARGLDVEEAIFQMRQDLGESANAWAIGVPVLYTSLMEPAPGFPRQTGEPRIIEHQPSLQVDALPRAQDVFRGRTRELLALGRYLTGTDRPRLVTIHGGGGQGKTALARYLFTLLPQDRSQKARVKKHKVKVVQSG